MDTAYIIAGRIGVDPGPLSLRELMLMAKGHAENAWTHTSALLSALWTGNSVHTKDPHYVSPVDMNPLLCGTEKATPKASVSILKTVFRAKKRK